MSPLAGPWSALVLAVVVLGGVAGADDRQDEVTSALDRLVEAPDAAADALGVLATTAPEALVAVLDQAIEVGPDGLPCGLRAEALAVALAGLPGARLEAVLAPAEATSAQARRARLTVLAHRDGTADLELALALATTPEPDGAAELARPLRSVATALHERSDAVGRALPGAVRSAPLALAEALVRALAAVERPATLERLAGLLGAVEPCDPLLLSLITRLGADRPGGVDRAIRAAVLDRLDAQDPSTRREAISAAVLLRDYDSVETLIARLEDEHRGVRENALWGLERLSRLQLGPDADRWRVWLALNHRWWVEDWPSLEAELRGGDHEATVEALRSVAGRRYRHNQVADAVAGVLERTDDELLLGFTCLALAALDSPATAAALVPLLDDSRPGVREAAHDALRRLTQLDLPADLELWSARLEQHPRIG